MLLKLPVDMPACGLRLPVHSLPVPSFVWRQALNLAVCMGPEAWLPCNLQRTAARGAGAACFTQQERVCPEQASRAGQRVYAALQVWPESLQCTCT